MPGVEKVARVAADPELRDVATAAITVLTRVSKEGEEAAAQPEAAKADPQVRPHQQRWCMDVGEGFVKPFAHIHVSLSFFLSLFLSDARRGVGSCQRELAMQLRAGVFAAAVEGGKA